MVDVVGGLWVEVADRVVADRGEVDHRVEADSRSSALDIADVHVQAFHLGAGGPERAGGEQVGVEPDDLMAGPLQQRDQHRADVAVVAGDEYAHRNLQ